MQKTYASELGPASAMAPQTTFSFPPFFPQVLSSPEANPRICSRKRSCSIVHLQQLETKSTSKPGARLGFAGWAVRPNSCPAATTSTSL